MSKKIDIIQLEQSELTTIQMDYSKKTRKELIEICKEKGIKGFSSKKKDEIVELLQNCTKTETPSITSS